MFYSILIYFIIFENNRPAHGRGGLGRHLLPRELQGGPDEVVDSVLDRALGGLVAVVDGDDLGAELLREVHDLQVEPRRGEGRRGRQRRGPVLADLTY